jgi:hypothetical protein
MYSDRIVAVLANIGQALEKLRRVRGEDDMHELAERIAAVMSDKLGPNERRLMFVSALMAAEAVDQEYVGWVLGGAVPFEDSKYPYWQMFLAREDDTEENRAAFQRSTAGAVA